MLDFTTTKSKPMRKSSKHLGRSKRVADGEIAVWTDLLNGLSRAARTIYLYSRRRREPNPLPIRSVCLYMRKWTICQFEWPRDNKILLPSQRATGNVVF